MTTRTRGRWLAAGGAVLLCAGAAATAVTSAAVSGSDRDAAAGHHTMRHHSGGHGTVVTVKLRDVAGAKVGTVRMKESDGVVVVRGAAVSLTPGFHGFHVHTTGLCEADAPAGPFTTAGGHYTGGDTTHGDHAGDLPPLLVTEEGEAYTSFVTDRFGLAELADADGSAVMVHAGPDNLANIPSRHSAGGVAGPDAATLATGDAGARVACGVID